MKMTILSVGEVNVTHYAETGKWYNGTEAVIVAELPAHKSSHPFVVWRVYNRPGALTEAYNGDYRTNHDDAVQRWLERSYGVILPN